MAKSRNRGGAKAHRKRVQKRNEKLGIQKKQFKKVFDEMYQTKMKELQEKFEQLSASTLNEENTEIQNETQTGTEEKVENSGTEVENSPSN